jgi:tetratricopeptide repeat protein
MRHQLFGVRHPDIANSLSNVGVLYEKQGNRQRALHYLKETTIDFQSATLCDRDWERPEAEEEDEQGHDANDDALRSQGFHDGWLRVGDAHDYR